MWFIYPLLPGGRRMKQCECCHITGTDDCSLIYMIYLSNEDDEIMLNVCHLCHALIKAHLPSSGSSSKDLR